MGGHPRPYKSVNVKCILQSIAPEQFVVYATLHVK